MCVVDYSSMYAYKDQVTTGKIIHTANIVFNFFNSLKRNIKWYKDNKNTLFMGCLDVPFVSIDRI